FGDGRDVMFVCCTRLVRHEIARTPRQYDFVCRRAATDCSSVAAEERYGRNFMRHGDRREMPATMLYWGASRYQPMGEPGRYSLMSAIANALASTLAHLAKLA